MGKVIKEEVTMLQIEDTLISLDLIEKKFVCNLDSCSGKCCVLGDAGAPLLKQEVKTIKKDIDIITKYISEAGKQAIRRNGISAIDDSGELVTALIDNKECVFTIFENGIAQCAIEKAWNNKETDFRKPVSCHLYPVRIKKYNEFIAVNYDKWQICEPAVISGEKLGVPLYVFLKDALVRRFGTGWYNELLMAVESLNEQNNNL